MSQVQYGGQAVIEGVMMRGPQKVAIAVRKSPAEIVVKEMPLRHLRFKFLKWPFIRGIVALISSLVIGIKSLSYSASQIAEEEEEEIKPWEMVLSILISFAFAVLLFVILPATLVTLFQAKVGSNFILNLIEGIIKISAFLIYLWAISRLQDIKRVFMYHGAEHKVIHNYEASLPLTISNARSFTTLHPRCGTNFLFIVILLSIFFFSFFGRPPCCKGFCIICFFYHLLPEPPTK